MVLNKPFRHPHAIVLLDVADVVARIRHHRIINVHHRDIFTVGTLQCRLQVDIGLRRNQQAVKALRDQGFRNGELTELIIFIGRRLISDSETILFRRILVALAE